MHVSYAALVCGQLDSPTNGAIIIAGDTRVGSTATYTCDEGFILTGGSETRVCTEDQTWTGTMPTCGKSV